jgi:hypothetical protein
VEGIFISIFEAKCGNESLANAADQRPKSNELSKSNDKKKRKIEETNHDQPNVKANVESNLQQFYSKKSLSKELNFLQIFLECFFQRKVFYSSVLLSESISKQITNISTICCLLKFMILILQDNVIVSNPSSPADSVNFKDYYFSTFTTYQLRNLIIFLEGILDGYFLKLAYEINRSNYQNEILSCFQLLIQIIHDMDSNLSEFHELSTLVVIYQRMISNYNLSAKLVTKENSNNPTKNSFMLKKEFASELNARSAAVDYYSVEKIFV